MYIVILAWVYFRISNFDPLVPLQCSFNSSSLKPITQHTVPVQLRVSSNHTEMLMFLVMETLHALIVLGCPWLTQHNPHIDWIKNTIVDWSTSCLFTYLHYATFNSVPPTSKKNFPDLSKVPTDYLYLQLVFSKSWVGSLPPHFPYSCIIDLPQEVVCILYHDLRTMRLWRLWKSISPSYWQPR